MTVERSIENRGGLLEKAVNHLITQTETVSVTATEIFAATVAATSKISVKSMQKVFYEI